MENYQFWTLVGLLAGGFAWMVTWLRSIDHRLNDLETRITVIETIFVYLQKNFDYVNLIVLYRDVN